MSTYLRRGRPVMINDGLVRLRVEEASGPRCRCRVEVGGVVSSQKGVNLPGTYLPIPSITDQDRENLAFAVEHDVDFVALSFVRRAEDVEELRQLIKGARRPPADRWPRSRSPRRSSSSTRSSRSPTG